jgi:ABC-2 type transport system ATP-binding protein
MTSLADPARRAAVETLALTRVFEPAKTFRRKGMEVVALDRVSLSIPEGEIHGLLGPNGAGKTTLVKILSTVLLPTSGEAWVLGHDVARDAKLVRPLIGIVFGGERGLYPRLTARQNLEYWAALYRLPRSQVRTRVDELIERVGLSERADHRVEAFSRGMKQRLHLARGLVGNANVLFLDEPTTGVDPLAAREFRRLVVDLRGEGRTILLATHDMVEAETVCDRVTLIDRGRIVATESPATLTRVISRFQRIHAHGVQDGLLERIRDLPGVRTATRQTDGSVTVELGDERTTGAALQCLVAAGVTSLTTSLPSLEDVYVALLGDRGLRL